MIAHLGMYDRPETAAANDRFWTLIREHLGRGPQQLSREEDTWRVWTSAGSAAGADLRLPLPHPALRRSGADRHPDHGLPGCPAGHYNSVFIARKTRAGEPLAAFDGAVFAYNDGLSQSGWAAPLIHLHDRSLLPGSLLETGSHQLSAKAVAEGRADFAALDALSWEMLCKYDSFAAGLCEIERTVPTPALPYITARGSDPEPLFAAIGAAIGSLGAEDRETLHLQGLAALTPSDYLAVPTPPGPVLTEMRIRQGKTP